MKTFNKSAKAILSIMLCVFASLSLSSCGDDEPGDTSEVAGYWVADDYDHFYSNVTLTFDSDGTGTATIDHNGAYVSIYRGEFTYKVKGNKVTTKGVLSNANSDGETSSSDFNNTFEIEGDRLYVVKGSSWYMSAVSSYRRY